MKPAVILGILLLGTTATAADTETRTIPFRQCVRQIDDAIKQYGEPAQDVRNGQQRVTRFVTKRSRINMTCNGDQMVVTKTRR